jgi:hypothetical protein
MTSNEKTARIDRRIARRKPEVTESHFAKWERQWDKRYGRSKPTWNAFVFDRDHEQLMRESIEAGQVD